MYIDTCLYIHIHTYIAIPASQLGAAWDGRQMHGTTEWTKTKGAAPEQRVGFTFTRERYTWGGRTYAKHISPSLPSQLGAAWDGRQMHGTTEWTKTKGVAPERTPLGSALVLRGPWVLDEKHKPILFYANGRVAGPWGRGSWSVEGERKVMLNLCGQFR